MTSQTMITMMVIMACLHTLAEACKTNIDCSLNGICSLPDGVCHCDAPWKGTHCGVLDYKVTPASGRSLYPETDPRNTWNGAIIKGPDNLYHLYNPIYSAGTLGGTTTMLHGISTNITGPYQWGKRPDINISYLHEFDGPKSVVFTDSITHKKKYSLWLGGGVYLADSVDGPFEKLDGFTYPGSNPAPLWHNGSFYCTNSPTQTIYTTPNLVKGAKWTEYGSVTRDGVPGNWLPEDPTMWTDKRGNWHIINHAFDPHEWKNCANSILSSHFFSTDGKEWHFLPEAIQPYNHTVHYDDGSSHMFVTLERPDVFLDENKQLTHINLAADLVTGDEGCGSRKEHQHFGHCPCDNCKYEDHGGTTIVSLNV